MTNSTRQQARFKRILARQSEPRWDADYVPAIKATVQEAPRQSRPRRLFSHALGREVHALSGPEAWALLLALYHPDVWDIKEQLMLSPKPNFHPLHGHPRAIGMQLPRLEGTLSAAQRLGQFAMHAKLYWREDDVQMWVPDLYVGDVLLFCADDQGPYCINWTIKANAAGFSLSGNETSRSPQKQHEKAAFRHNMEALYYSDASIRTQRITQDGIDVDLALNLERLFAYHCPPTCLCESASAQVVAMCAGALETSVTAFALCGQIQRMHGLDYAQAKHVLLHAIWMRRIKVDLFTPVLMDKPLRAERTDPLRRYAAWFSRS